jgi:putative transposase
MNQVNKTFKYRLYPTENQKMLLAQHFGAKRWVWNHFLEKRKDAYIQDKKTINYYDCSASLTKLKKKMEFAWLKQVNSQSMQASLRDLDTAYNRFFHKESRFPKFKSRHHHQSFRIPQSVVVEGDKLWIPKFKTALEVNVHRPLDGKILFATISRTQTGEYYVAITCECQHQSIPSAGKTIGIDLGLETLVACSDGVKFDNIRTSKKHRKRLAYQQRQLAKKQKGSKRRQEQKIQVAKVHKRIRNVRQNHLHNISSKLVCENQTICFESLSVLNMMKNHCLAGAISDAGWGELIRQIKYKSEWNDRNAVQIDRFFPSSKTCHVCGYIHQGLLLKDREWDCPKCQAHHDRDDNASQNILREGLNLSGLAIKSDLKQKGMEAFARAESMKCQAAGSLAQR